MEECPFCDEGKNVFGEIILKNDYAYAVTSKEAVLKTAVMVIPNRHIKTPFDFSTKEWEAVHKLMVSAKTYLDKDKPNGYSVGWNVGEVAGQHVEHVHLHIVGRFADEPLAGKGIRYFLKQENNRRPS